MTSSMYHPFIHYCACCLTDNKFLQFYKRAWFTTIMIIIIMIHVITIISFHLESLGRVINITEFDYIYEVE